MAGVRWVGERIAEWVDDEEPIQGGERTLPHVHRQRSAEAALHPADRRLGYSDDCSEPRLCQATPPAGVPKLAACSRELLAIAAGSFRGEFGTLEPWHIATMIAVRALLPITR